MANDACGMPARYLFLEQGSSLYGCITMSFLAAQVEEEQAAAERQQASKRHTQQTKQRIEYLCQPDMGCCQVGTLKVALHWQLHVLGCWLRTRANTIKPINLDVRAPQLSRRLLHLQC